MVALLVVPCSQSAYAFGKKKKKKKPDRQQKAPQYAELFLRTVFIWHLYRWNPMQYLFR